MRARRRAAVQFILGRQRLRCHFSPIPLTPPVTLLVKPHSPTALGSPDCCTSFIAAKKVACWYSNAAPCLGEVRIG